LTPLSEELANLDGALSELRAAQSHPSVDLEPLVQRLASLQEAVGALPAPADLTGTDRRLTAIEHALFPVQTRLDEMESAVRALRSAPPADISVLLERFDALQKLLDSRPTTTGGPRPGPQH